MKLGKIAGTTCKKNKKGCEKSVYKRYISLNLDSDLQHLVYKNSVKQVLCLYWSCIPDAIVNLTRSYNNC